MATQAVENQEIRLPKKSEKKRNSHSASTRAPHASVRSNWGPAGFPCRICAVTYPIRDGIPDFIVEKLEESSNWSLRMLGKRDSTTLLDFAVGVYETCVYPVVCNLYGGWRSTSLKQLAHEVSDIVGSRDGLILDAACGPGFYDVASRRHQGPFMALMLA